MVVDDEQLTKMAAEELLEEARRGAIRAKTMGPEGWKKCPLPKTNKRCSQSGLRQFTTNYDVAIRSQFESTGREVYLNSDALYEVLDAKEFLRSLYKITLVE